MLRLGDLTAGPIATVAPGGVVTLPGDSSTRWSWWIGAEDGWHRPAHEPTTQDAALDGAPGLRTTARIPGGDFVGTATAVRFDALDGPTLLFELDNASAVPVAVAFVVESDRPITVRDGGIDVDGVGALRLTRVAAASLSASSADALVTALVEAGIAAATTGASTRISDGTVVSGAAAVVIPLPHAAHALAAVVQRPETGTVPTTLDRPSVPRVEQVVRGWSAHLGSSPELHSGVDRRDALVRSAAADVLLGPDWDNTDAVEVALVAEALGRLGRVDLFDAMTALLNDLRPNGSFDAPDPFSASLQFIRAVSATWSGGCAPDAGERLLEAAALAVHYLSKRRNRAAVAARRSEVSFALESLIGLADDIGEGELAERLRGRVGELGVGSPLVGQRADEWVHALGAGFSFGFDAASQPPSVAASAAFVIRATCELAVERADGLDVFSGYVPSLAGREIDVRQLPTRWGIVSYSLRWHGRRPAVLWEMTPWRGRSAAHEFALTASTLDPRWQHRGSEGEALLAEPAEADFETPPQFMHDHLLSESSDGHLHGDWDAVPDFGDTSDLPDAGTFT